MIHWIPGTPRLPQQLLVAGGLLAAWLAASAAVAQEEPVSDSAEKESEVPAGHSYHGEAFNEGPRQQAYLMAGTGDVHVEITTTDPRAQKFFDQGIGQLHGFWYFEAERSFRQAAVFDPDAPMVYLGMALANWENRDRARKLLQEGLDRIDAASGREKLWIRGLEKFLDDYKEDRKRASRNYVRSLEGILHGYPDELEAKAFLVVRLWQFKRDLPINSHQAVDALIDQILEVEPMHPVHHYRIHLWDYEKPERALSSAARSGQSAPDIAHMWHMGGHIYSRLKRYHDACWQQEASARVDHAHMIRDRVLPDQIHNYAHNNEWLTRNLIHVGRVREAVALAKNMLELPRHPKYNTLARRGRSASYGRERLFQVLETYELWDDLLHYSGTVYLEPTDLPRGQVRRLRAIGRAHFGRRDERGVQDVIARLESRLATLEAESDAAAEKARADLRAEKAREAENVAEAAATQETNDVAEGAVSESGAAAEPTGTDSTESEGDASSTEPSDASDVGDEEKGDSEPSSADDMDADPNEAQEEEERAVKRARRPFKERRRQVEGALSELRVYDAALRGDAASAGDLLEEARGIGDVERLRVWLALDDLEQAEEVARKYAERSEKEVAPLAWLAYVLEQTGKSEEAGETFEKLRAISFQIDLEAPPFRRLRPLATRLGHAGDWRLEQEESEDVGKRPEVERLGPFRWAPPEAPSWRLPSGSGGHVALEDYRGRPVIVIFYLGFGCLHCVEQLKIFAPKQEAFEELGISLVAISTEERDTVEMSLEAFNEEGEFPIPLLADPGLEVFKAYRAHDDFEEQPLHGTFVIDSDGKIRWQDISYEPFAEVDFLIEECQRLLGKSPSLASEQRRARF